MSFNPRTEIPLEPELNLSGRENVQTFMTTPSSEDSRHLSKNMQDCALDSYLIHEIRERKL